MSRSTSRRTPTIAGAMLAAMTMLGVSVSAAADSREAAVLSSDRSVAAPDAGAFAPQPLDEATTLRVGISAPIESFLVLLLAAELGEFAAENLDVEITIVPPTESPLLLSQGHLDVVPSSASAGFFNMVAEGLEIRGVFPLAEEPEDTGQGFWIRKDALGDDGVFQPEDLRGQRVLTPNGSGSFTVAYFWTNFLGPAGLEPNDVTWERVALPDAPLALIGGAAPAAVVLTPFWTTLQDDGCCVLIEGAYPTYATSFYMFGPTLLNGDPAVGEAFVRALARTTVTYLQGDYHNDPEIGPLTAELLQQPFEIVQSLPSLIWNPEFEFRSDELETVQSFFISTGDVTFDAPLPFEQIYDRRFVEALEVGS